MVRAAGPPPVLNSPWPIRLTRFTGKRHRAHNNATAPSNPDIVSKVTLPDGLDYLRRVVRQRIETEGLRPLAGRTGVPVGQLRSVVEGRAARSTTLELIASVLELEFYIGPVRGDSTRPVLPPEIAQALDLPRDASVADAVGAIDKDALASKLREGIGRVQELMGRASAAAALISEAVPDREPPASEVAMIPFARDVRLAAGTGELVFEESPDVSIAVAAKALASWARPDRLTCVRVVGDSMEPTIRDGDLVAVDATRTDPLNGRLFALWTDTGLVAKRLRRTGDGWVLISDNPIHAPRPVAEDDRIVGRVAWYGPPGRQESVQ